VLVHLVDCSPEEGGDPVADWDTINRDLALYSPYLATKSQIAVATKLDVEGAAERADALEKHLAATGQTLLRISAVTNEGLQPLLDAMVQALDAAGPPAPLPFEELPEDVVGKAYNRAEESESEEISDESGASDDSGDDDSGDDSSGDDDSGDDDSGDGKETA